MCAEHKLSIIIIKKKSQNVYPQKKSQVKTNHPVETHQTFLNKLQKASALQFDYLSNWRQ